MCIYCCLGILTAFGMESTYTDTKGCSIFCAKQKHINFQQHDFSHTPGIEYFKKINLLWWKSNQLEELAKATGLTFHSKIGIKYSTVPNLFYFTLTLVTWDKWEVKAKCFIYNICKRLSKFYSLASQTFWKRSLLYYYKCCNLIWYSTNALKALLIFNERN